MNIIEQLMVEHLALRLHFRFIRDSGNSNSIYELEDFVRKCHAKIEDEVVFPKLQSVEDVSRSLSRLEADHKLIDKIGDQIKIQTEEGNAEVLKKRIALYMTTVESHNSSEESLVFPHWDSISSSIEPRDEVSRARKIIDEFGLNRYLAITSFSQHLLESVR